MVFAPQPTTSAQNRAVEALQAMKRRTRHRIRRRRPFRLGPDSQANEIKSIAFFSGRNPPTAAEALRRGDEPRGRSAQRMKQKFLCWFIVLREDAGRVIVAESSYGATLLVELTIILLYSQLKIDYLQDGKARSVLLHFNTVTQNMYAEAVKSILDAIDAPRDGVMTPKLSGTTLLSGWPLKFRNFSILYTPQNSQLLDGVCWEEMRGVFGRELAPAAALVVTDRHIIVIAEEKISRWFQFRRSTKYGAIISYLPLDRFTGFQIKLHRRSRVLELENRGNSGGETLDITIPPDKEEAVHRAMQKARLNRAAASNVLRIGVK